MRKRHAILCGLGSLIGLFLLFFLLTSEEIKASFRPLAAVGAIAFGVALAYSVYGFSSKLDQLLPWQKQAGWRWLVGLVSNTLLVYLLSYLALQTAGLWLPDLPTTFDQAPHLFLKFAILLLLLVLIYTVLYFALYSYQHYGQLQLAHLQQERERIDLQWAALRNQLQPHFLFNSLNTISALIYRDRHQAETFIRNLADTYRYPLNNYDRNLVSLREELDFVRAYHYLLQTRFGDHLQLSIDVPIEAQASQVPPLSLQLLIENAVKHNTISEEEPLHIQLGADEDTLWISNNITSSPPEVDSFSIGLKNIRSRYRLLSKRNIELKKGESFLVKIPLLR